MSLNHNAYSELTTEQAELIGRIGIEWSNVEYLLGQLLSRVLMTPEFLGRVYTDQMGAVQLQKAITQAVEIQRVRYGCRVLDYDLLQAINKINPAIDVARGMRNRFAHFCWARSSDVEIFGTAFSAALPHQKESERDFRTLSIDELKRAHKTVWDIVEEVTKLLARIPESTEEDALKMKGVQPRSWSVVTRSLVAESEDQQS